MFSLFSYFFAWNLLLIFSTSIIDVILCRIHIQCIKKIFMYYILSKLYFESSFFYYFNRKLSMKLFLIRWLVIISIVISVVPSVSYDSAFLKILLSYASSFILKSVIFPFNEKFSNFFCYTSYNLFHTWYIYFLEL